MKQIQREKEGADSDWYNHRPPSLYVRNNNDEYPYIRDTTDWLRIVAKEQRRLQDDQSRNVKMLLRDNDGIMDEIKRMKSDHSKQLEEIKTLLCGILETKKRKVEPENTQILPVAFPTHTTPAGKMVHLNGGNSIVRKVAEEIYGVDVIANLPKEAPPLPPPISLSVSQVQPQNQSQPKNQIQAQGQSQIQIQKPKPKSKQ